MANGNQRLESSEQVIRPEQVHLYAPGEIVAEGDSGADRRRRVFFREFRYQPSVVAAPGINSLLMVVYRGGHTLMRRRCDGAWQECFIQPGAISLLGAGLPSAWEWDQPIAVSHIYLSYDLLAETAGRALDQDYRRFSPCDELNVDDGRLRALADLLVDEFREPSVGGNLLIDSVAQAMCLYTLRSYHRHQVAIREPNMGRFLTPGQQRRALEFIEAHPACNFDLAELAGAAGVSSYHFIRCFKNSLGVSPYQFIMRKRVDRVVDLLRHSQAPLAEIAVSCGFSDQSHMTRTLRKTLGLTPAAIRRSGH
jgi:AraC family transcriptional regulator